MSPLWCFSGGPWTAFFPQTEKLQRFGVQQIWNEMNSVGASLCLGPHLVSWNWTPNLAYSIPEHIMSLFLWPPPLHTHTPLLSWDYPKEEGYATARALCPVHSRNKQPPYNWVVCPPGSKFHLLWVSRLWRMRDQELCRKAEDAWNLKPLFFWHHFHGVWQWGMSLTF